MTQPAAPFNGRPIRRYTFSGVRPEELEEPAKPTWRTRLAAWFGSKTAKKRSKDNLVEKIDSPVRVDPREELFRRMIGDRLLDDALELKWAWFLKFLDARILEIWSNILANVLEGLTLEYSQSDSAQLARVYEVLVIIAEAINTQTEFCIDDIVKQLQAKKDYVKADASTNSIRQLVWIFAGHLTMLYDPECIDYLDNAGNHELCLRRPATLARARSRARGSVLTSFAEDPCTAEDQFHESLARFGALIPKPMSLSPKDRPPSLGNIEHLNVAYLCVDGLKKVARLRIEWVNTLELHLQLDQRKRILRLFRFPTFCELLYKDSGRGFLNQLYTDHHMSQIHGSAEEEHDYDLTFSDYLREVILSYRLLFGIDARSRQCFREETQAWQNDGSRVYDKDPLLWQLCTGHGSSAKMRELLEGFDGEETSTLFALEDFPFLGRRLAELQRFAIWQKPNSWKILWQDQRDVKDWWMVWTAWAVLFIGGGTVVLQFFQLAFQIWSTVMQYWSPSSPSPAGGL